RPRVRVDPRRGHRARPVRRVLLQATDRVPDRALEGARGAQGLRSDGGDGGRPRGARHHDRSDDGARGMTFREFADVYRGYRIPRFKLIEHRNWWFIFSGVLIVLAIVGIVFRGFNFSIDFEGGAQLSYPLHTGATVQDIESVLAKYGLTGEVQVVSGDSVAIRTQSLTGRSDSTKILGDLASEAGVTAQDINVQDIGPSWGAEISKKALRGLIIVLIAIGLYIAFRFEWAMAAGAMIALVHDVTITAGVYALTGRVVTPETVIAIL